eukprot:14514111-Heterocapsa_arctica.AAC.1
MLGFQTTPTCEWTLLIEIFKALGEDAHLHNALVGWTSLCEFPENSFLISAGSMEYLEDVTAYQIICMGVVVSK